MSLRNQKVLHPKDSALEKKFFNIDYYKDLTEDSF